MVYLVLGLLLSPAAILAQAVTPAPASNLAILRKRGRPVHCGEGTAGRPVRYTVVKERLGRPLHQVQCGDGTAGRPVRPLFVAY